MLFRFNRYAFRKGSDDVYFFRPLRALIAQLFGRPR